MKFLNQILFLISFFFVALILFHLSISNWQFLITDIGAFLILLFLWRFLKRKESKELIIVVFALFLIFIFEILSMSFFYFEFSDLISHFLGGFFLTWGVCIYFKDDIKKINIKFKKIFLISSICAFFFLSWEFLEFLFDFYIGSYFSFPKLSPSLEDLFKDFSFDFLGSLVFLVRKFLL